MILEMIKLFNLIKGFFIWLWMTINPPKVIRYLGKLEKKIDPRNLIFEKYLTTKIPVPATLNRQNLIKEWLMLGNNTLGNCTIAGVYHLEMFWKALIGKVFTPTDHEAITTYSAITGYSPNKPNSDNGAMELDVLKYWRKNGIFNETMIDGSDKISAFIEIKNLYSSSIIKLATYLFNGVYIGFQVPQYILDGNSDIWKVQKGGDQSIAGGHAVIIFDYDKNYLYICSWGRVYKMTWGFYLKYTDEAYAVISPDYFNAGRSVEGFDLKTIQADLGLL